MHQRLALLFPLMLTVYGGMVHAQEGLDSVQLRTVKGKMVYYPDVAGHDSLVLICFWATTSEESIEELNAINAHYTQWKESFPFHFLAISVDEGLANRVKPVINMNGWPFEIYIDLRGDLRRALHFGSLPQSMILRSGKVVYQQAGFLSGTENYLLQKLQEIYIRLHR
jgi:cytochrome c biogenesis protein CcmG/thiol:disulfide interchange protein DsbE